IAAKACCAWVIDVGSSKLLCVPLLVSRERYDRLLRIEYALGHEFHPIVEHKSCQRIPPHHGGPTSAYRIKSPDTAMRAAMNCVPSTAITVKDQDRQHYECGSPYMPRQYRF